MLFAISCKKKPENPCDGLKKPVLALVGISHSLAVVVPIGEQRTLSYVK
jgi:hypothetical protein